jgi:hypothetical protein
VNSTPLQCMAHFLASQFIKAYEEAEETGRAIEEVARLDLLVAVARQVVADVAREEEATARIPQWRIPIDGHTAIEFARMAQSEIAHALETPAAIEVCDYVMSATRAFEEKYRATEWGENNAPDWMEATEAFWQQYTSAQRPTWRDDVEDARAECEAEALCVELRRLGYNVTGLDGRVEIRDVETGETALAMECHGDGTCAVENYAEDVHEDPVAIATMITYARIVKVCR